MQRMKGLLLGAGASYEVGMPLVWELTEELKKHFTAEKVRELNKGWYRYGNGKPDEVVNNLIDMLECEEIHYESLLGYLEVQYQRNGKNREHYHSLYMQFTEIVYGLLYRRHIQNSDFIKRNIERYKGLKSLVGTDSTLWVFSLNHDVIIELVAEQFEIPIYSGFSAEIVNFPRRRAAGEIFGNIKAELLREGDLNRGVMHFPNPLQNGIYLLKLHGALDQFAINDGKDLVRLLPDLHQQKDAIAILQSANEDLLYVDTYSPNGSYY